MGLFDWLTSRNKPLAKMDRKELRQQELLLEKERSQLLKRVEKRVKEKQSLFERGKAEATPEVRRVLAQDFAAPRCSESDRQADARQELVVLAGVFQALQGERATDIRC